jgi:hypothetical protein
MTPYEISEFREKVESQIRPEHGIQAAMQLAEFVILTEIAIKLDDLVTEIKKGTP